MSVQTSVSPKEHFVQLSPGKMFGLKTVADQKGLIRVLALDQSNSFKKFLRALYEKQGQKKEPTYEEIRDAKLEITEVLCPLSTSVLLDVNYGARQALNAGSLARGVGLIIRVEASKDAGTPGEYEPGWSVAKIKKMGGAAVKLLVYMNTDDKKATENQVKFAKQVQDDCAKEDILLMTEELSYPNAGEDNKAASYLARKPQNIFNSIDLLNPLTDILKLEYPANVKTDDVKTQEKNLATLNEKAQRPWVLLSAGVHFDIFVDQVALAMKAGASGIMAGRAIFQEYFDYTTPAERRKFLQTTGLDRMKKLNDVVEKYATPWYKRYNLTNTELLNAVSPDWYAKGVTASGSNVKGEY